MEILLNLLFLSFLSLGTVGQLIDGQQTFFTDLSNELVRNNVGVFFGTLSCGFERSFTMLLGCNANKQLAILSIADFKLETIPSSISNVGTALTSINLRSNGLTSLGEGFGFLSNLVSLTVFNSQLSTLPVGFTYLSNLSYLYLSNCSFTSITESFTKLTNLKFLHFGNNLLSDISPTISSLSLITGLYLNNNRLLTLPNELSSLRSIVFLNLQYNHSLIGNTDLFKNMDQLSSLYVDNTLISGSKPRMCDNFLCKETCVSEPECTKNNSCSCSSFDLDFCSSDRCDLNAQNLCVECASLLSEKQCTGSCEWCSGEKDGNPCNWCDSKKNHCSNIANCYTCFSYSTSELCKADSSCQWCDSEYCTPKNENCKLICSNLTEETCESGSECLWCSSYSICLDSTAQCWSCDRFTSSFCPPGCKCSNIPNSNSSVIIVVCVVCCVIFLLICVFLFVFFVLKRRTVSSSNELKAVSNSNTSLRFETDIGLSEPSEHPVVSKYSECCVDSLFRVSPDVLSFSSSGSPLKLCTPVTVSFEMTNVCRMELVVERLFVRGFKEKHEFVFSPSSFTIGVNEKRKISVELVMKCSGSLSPSQSLICCGVSTKQQWCSLCGIQAQSELSPLLSCDDIELKRELGRGAFGKVFLGSFKGTEVAIKISNGMSADDFNIEANTLSKLHSPHIVTFFGISQTLNAMIIEYCKYGSVDEYYSNHSLKKELKRLICFDISRGMKYLHLNGIIHRDLKPANVLLSSLSTDLNVSRAKISDFGTSRSSKMTMKMTKGVGTPSFMAPEIFDTQEYGRSSDIYAFGMTIWSIFTQKTPFEEELMSAIIVLLSEGKRPPLPSSTICDFNDLIERCWAQNPHQRPSFEEITDFIKNRIET